VASTRRVKEIDVAILSIRFLITKAPIVVAVLTMSACSIDGIGFASSEVFDAQGARAVRTETYGIALRTTAADAGVTIGYSSTLTVLPDCPEAPRAGRHMFGVSTSGLRPVAVLRRTSGVTVDTNRRAVGVMLGFSEDGFFTAIPVDESVHRRLVFTPDDPSRIEFRQISEKGPCS
jgi:hypothetical protein